MSDQVSREVLPIPDRPYEGDPPLDAKDPSATFPPIQPLHPPSGAPNVLVVLLDDVGFGASSAFGGPCATPTAERLAANGLLQNVVQPIAFGSTLDLNPLVVLIVTIGFGCIFGMVGLVLGAPLTSAALHISRELAAAKQRVAAEDAGRAPPHGSEPETVSV